MIVKQSDLRAILMNKLCGEGNFIRVPENAEYSAEDATNVLLYAATSTSNSVESAATDLRTMNPGSKIPCADTIYNYINSNDIDEMLSFFRKMNSDLIDVANLRDTSQTIAIDFHDIPYYGDKNTKGVVGIKPKNGTPWGYSFFTVDIADGCKLTLDIVNLTGLNKNYATLIKGAINRLNRLGITIKMILADREFFNLAVITTLDSTNTDYIIPAKVDKRMKKMINEFEKENGRVPGIIEYKFRDKRSPTFYLVLIPNKNYDPSKKDGKGNKKFFVFATNVKFSSVKRFIKSIPEEYKKRWNIETGYRMKNVFKIRTCSTSPVARSLFFILQCIMHNYLTVLKRVVSITAYTLKSVICKDICDCLRAGYDLICNQSIIEFYKRMKCYNEDRDLELRQHLGLI